MNNYIPINKAVKPICIYEGYEPLINKKKGVDAMTINFDGTPSDYTTCIGAPEMFIKVEQDGLYYFGVEADDSGLLKIADEKFCEKKGERPHGKLELETASRYLKAGYHKVTLSYSNNAYDPVSNNAIAFNVTMDTKPIEQGKYTDNSTINRTFSTSPKIMLWTIEKESNIKCEDSKAVEFTFERSEPAYLTEAGDCTAEGIKSSIFVTVCRDEAANVWRTRVISASGGTKVTIRTGDLRDALLDPPKNETEAVQAVNLMNGYQSRGSAEGWHTTISSLAHENHHRREYEDAFKFYWKYMKVQEDIEKKTFSLDENPDMDLVIQFAQLYANICNSLFWIEVNDYVLSLPDKANDRPYCAGQLVLNITTSQIIKQAKANGWNEVPDKVTEYGTIEPPCFLPPVSEGKLRSRVIVEEQNPLKLSIEDTSRLMQGNITVCFRNEGRQTVRIPDEIKDNTADFFFMTILKTEQGDVRVLNSKTGKITFQHPLNYLDLVPGEEYRVTIPVCLDDVEVETWKQCSCELETRYYNQHGKDCFLGKLRATSQIML